MTTRRARKRGALGVCAPALALALLAACSRTATRDGESARIAPPRATARADAGSGAGGTAPSAVDPGVVPAMQRPPTPPARADAGVGRAPDPADSGTPPCTDCAAGCTGPSCPKPVACAVEDCAADGRCQLVADDARCAHFDAPCISGRCDPMLGCVARVDPACDCHDGNPCTDDRAAVDRQLMPGQSACVHTSVTCAADDVACTVDVCDPNVGCAHVPDAALCEDDSPCTTQRCDAALGCVTEPAGDGTVCDEARCGQSFACSAGACVAQGVRDPACDVWFTPGDHGMLPWDVAACGSNVADGVLPGAFGNDGVYTIRFADLFASGDRLLYSPRYYPWQARLFDGERWSAPDALAPVPDAIGGLWLPLGFTANGELALAGPNPPNQCSTALRVDLRTQQFTPYNQLPLAAAACAPGTTDTRLQSVKLAPDGRLWAFNHEGAFTFDGSAWQRIDCEIRTGIAFPDIAFGARGEVWLIGGDKSHLTLLEDGTCRPLPLPSMTVPRVATHAFTPSGSLLINSEHSVLEVMDRGVIEYPPLPDGKDGVLDLASDVYGRPLVRADSDYLSLELWRFEASGWKPLGYSESVVNDERFRVFTTMQGKVERIEQDRRFAVGPVHAHRSLSAGEQVLAPHTLSMQSGSVSLDWLLATDRQPSGIRDHVYARRSTLAGASLQTQSVELTLTEESDCRRYGRSIAWHSVAGRTVLSCMDHELAIFDGHDVEPIAVGAEAPVPYFFSGAQVAVAADPAGSLYVAYINEVTRGLHIGHLDAAAQLTLDHTVPGAVTDSPVILHETPMVDLAWTAEGLAVLWQGRESEEAQWQRGAKLFVNGVWSELPNAPPGVAAVDRQGRLWLDGANEGSVLPARWTGSEWLSVAGGPVAHAWPGTMVFDADDNPIVAAGQNDIAVLRHEDGQWRAVQGSDRPGGVTNSPCNISIDPQLAIEGDRLCMSWLEATEKPFGLLLRCTQLLD